MFNLALEKATRAIRTSPGGTIYNRMSQHLAYADDVLITGHTKAAVEGALEEFEKEAKLIGLKINEGKTVYMRTSRNPSAASDTARFNDHEFAKVDSFKYLGAIVTSKNEIEAEIKARIAAANRCLLALSKAIRFRNLSRDAKITIYKTIVRPVATYGCETWDMSKKNENMLAVWERKVLRKIYGPKTINGQWRMRNNMELYELYKEPDIVIYIKRARLRWFGHVERMGEERLPKKLLIGRPDGNRPRGRPRLRWMDDVQQDLKELGVRRWRVKAQDRNEWRKLVSEAWVH